MRTAAFRVAAASFLLTDLYLQETFDERQNDGLITAAVDAFGTDYQQRVAGFSIRMPTPMSR